MTRSIYRTPWSTVKAVTFPPRRLFQNSGASRRGSVVGALSHLMGKASSITSRNSRIEFPFTLTDQENLRVAVQEETKQTTQLPKTESIQENNDRLPPLRKKESKKFLLSFSNITNSNNNKNSGTSTPKKKQKSSTPAVYVITIEDKSQLLCIYRQITDFIEFDQQIRQEFPKSRPTLPTLDDRRKSFLLPKHFFFRKTTAEKLESYLRKVLTDSNLKNLPSLREFLSVKTEKDYIRWKNGALNKQILENSPPDSWIQAAMRPISQQIKSTIDDYELIKVLGKGCMGKVFLSREKTTNKLYALKAISKEWVVFRQEIEHTKTERDILAAVATITHPFIIRLRESFQDSNRLFLVLDYYPGGDIATQLAKWHKFDEERCLFYAAEIILGIEELHRLGIVYRDLKPENILIGRDGHIVLTDFGLSKQFKPSWQKTNTFCGTAEYLAPEIIRAEDYSYPVDWWSLGTLLYEMMTGITPFWAEDQNRMYHRVLEDELEFPEGMSPEAMSLLQGLLQRDPRNRLGCGSGGSLEIKTHPYFSCVDWDDVFHKRIYASYIPTIEHSTDLQNFDDTFVSMSPRLSTPRQEVPINMQQYFGGYSFSGKHPPLRSQTSSYIRSKSITSSMAGIPSHGSQSSTTLSGYDQYDEYDYNEILYSRGIDIANNNNRHSRCDDISEFELDHYSKRHTIMIGETNKFRNNLSMISQFVMDETLMNNSSASSSATKLERRGALSNIYNNYS
ncbi:6054_t:CDS:2 [Diversispora eburnea]|uniref:6054_t:CDS:1 n=1 Tax=Diversispora eburnea TaxID=1213867 RepID=A0A9N8ZN29_9GLOM|nr:6054_t:CDS:2 [Diversispora eburnea]